MDNLFQSFLQNIFSLTHHDSVMLLSIYVDGDDVLKDRYVVAAQNHNQKLLQDPHFYDAGFDLFLPSKATTYDEGTPFYKNHQNVPINKVNFKVKCCAQMYKKNNESVFSPFYTYMRSSMSKTPLRLANNQGIIDAGYRGPLIGMFDCLYKENMTTDCDYYMDPYTRMLQICAPGLVPIYVHVVDELAELGPSTSRGEGGFGSTGR